LQDGYYIPRSVYGSNRAPKLKNPNPILLSDGKAKQVSTQLPDTADKSRFPLPSVRLGLTSLAFSSLQTRNQLLVHRDVGLVTLYRDFQTEIVPRKACELRATLKAFLLLGKSLLV
jgi:hypothetical protein